MYARVIDGVITEIVGRPNWYLDSGEPVDDTWLLENENLRVLLEGDLPTVNDETQYIEQNEYSQWVINDTTVTKTYTIINIPFEETKEVYLRKPHDIRKLYEEGGINFTDTNTTILRIQTDRASQAKISASYMAAKDGIRTENSLWKTMDGFVAISNVDMISLGQAVLNHVQLCFNNENVLYNEVNGCTTYTQLQEIDFSAGWPSNSIQGQ